MSASTYHEPSKGSRTKPKTKASKHRDAERFVAPPQNWLRGGALAQAVTLLRPFGGSIAFDEFAEQVVIKGPLTWARPQDTREWSDHDTRLAAEWLQRQGVNASPTVTADAVEIVAREWACHPVRDYLSALTWDGKSRLEGWLFYYLNVEPSCFTLAVAKAWLISAVARVFQPGCKADHILVLEGRQGIGKSRALKILAGDHFTDEIADLGSKDAAMQLRGKWILELAELDALNRTEAGRIKAFLSRSADRYRPPYGRQVLEVLRQCVFAGSTNRSEYLSDETGARRFWTVTCGDQIELDDLARDRDQLWAEAVHFYRSGAKWWLDDNRVEREASMEQSERFEQDPWHSTIASYLKDREETSLEQLWGLLGKDISERTRYEQKRLRDVLHAMGWRKNQVRRDGSRVRVFRRAEE